jgi:DNA-binding protein YbaB
VTIDPQQWAHEQQERTAALLERAEQAKATLEQSQVTVSAPDQSVTVTVNPGGALLELRFSPRAQALTLSQLAARVMATYRRACAEASARTMEVMTDLVGPGSSALDLLRSTLPAFDDDASGGSQT